MESTHTIQENLSYLHTRFKSEKINIGWKDRKAFGTLIDYIEEKENEDVDYKMYLRRLTTYIIVQYLELILEEGLTKKHIERAIRKIEMVYKVTHEDWETAFASKCWAFNTDSDYNDYKVLLNALVSDVIRYNTRTNDISAVQNRL